MQTTHCRKGMSQDMRAYYRERNSARIWESAVLDKKTFSSLLRLHINWPASHFCFSISILFSDMQSTDWLTDNSLTTALQTLVVLALSTIPTFFMHLKVMQFWSANLSANLQLSQQILWKRYHCTEALSIEAHPIPLSIRLAGSTVWSLQCVAYITSVGHYRVVGCTGESTLSNCGTTKITTINGWED